MSIEKVVNSVVCMLAGVGLLYIVQLSGIFNYVVNVNPLPETSIMRAPSIHSR